MVHTDCYSRTDSVTTVGNPEPSSVNHGGIFPENIGTSAVFNENRTSEYSVKMGGNPYPLISTCERERTKDAEAKKVSTVGNGRTEFAAKGK